MTVALKNFIGGEWVDGSGITRNINPSNTDDVVGEYAQGRQGADRRRRSPPPRPRSRPGRARRRRSATTR